MRPGAAILAASLAAASPVLALPDGFPVPPGSTAASLDFAALPGWQADDQAAAFRAFQRSCAAIVGEISAIKRAPTRPPAALAGICASAIAGEDLDAEAARAFFENRFDPVEIVPTGRDLLTAYYEPDFAGSPVPTADFTTPLLALPGDLVVVRPDEAGPDLPPGTTVARRTEAGLVPYPDRAAIETGALGDAARPLVFVRDAVDAFIIQVQGSARIRLPDGGSLRVAYAGRNGQPYSSIARLVVQRLGIPPSQLDADRLTGWLRANPTDARDLMRRNKSYVFFRVAEELGPEDGPVGTVGVPLIAGRSIAIDPAVWSFGLPVWLDGSLPRPDGGRATLQRLTVGQDSGTAITGPTRADLFLGAGEAAGREAGLVREQVRFVVLWPKAPATP